MAEIKDIEYSTKEELEKEREEANQQQDIEYHQQQAIIDSARGEVEKKESTLWGSVKDMALLIGVDAGISTAVEVVTGVILSGSGIGELGLIGYSLLKMYGKARKFVRSSKLLHGATTVASKKLAGTTYGGIKAQLYQSHLEDEIAQNGTFTPAQIRKMLEKHKTIDNYEKEESLKATYGLLAASVTSKIFGHMGKLVLGTKTPSPLALDLEEQTEGLLKKVRRFGVNAGVKTGENWAVMTSYEAGERLAQNHINKQDAKRKGESSYKTLPLVDKVSMTHNLYWAVVMGFGTASVGYAPTLTRSALAKTKALTGIVNSDNINGIKMAYSKRTRKIHRDTMFSLLSDTKDITGLDEATFVRRLKESATKDEVANKGVNDTINSYTDYLVNSRMSADQIMARIVSTPLFAARIMKGKGVGYTDKILPELTKHMIQQTNAVYGDYFLQGNLVPYYLTQKGFTGLLEEVHSGKLDSEIKQALKTIENSEHIEFDKYSNIGEEISTTEKTQRMRSQTIRETIKAFADRHMNKVREDLKVFLEKHKNMPNADKYIEAFGKGNGSVLLSKLDFDDFFNILFKGGGKYLKTTVGDLDEKLNEMDVRVDSSLAAENVGDKQARVKKVFEHELRNFKRDHLGEASKKLKQDYKTVVDFLDSADEEVSGNVDTALRNVMKAYTELRYHEEYMKSDIIDSKSSVAGFFNGMERTFRFLPLLMKKFWYTSLNKVSIGHLESAKDIQTEAIQDAIVFNNNLSGNNLIFDDNVVLETLSSMTLTRKLAKQRSENSDVIQEAMGVFKKYDKNLTDKEINDRATNDEVVHKFFNDATDKRDYLPEGSATGDTYLSKTDKDVIINNLIHESKHKNLNNTALRNKHIDELVGITADDSQLKTDLSSRQTYLNENIGTVDKSTFPVSSEGDLKKDILDSKDPRTMEGEDVDIKLRDYYIDNRIFSNAKAYDNMVHKQKVFNSLAVNSKIAYESPNVKYEVYKELNRNDVGHKPHLYSEMSKLAEHITKSNSSEVKMGKAIARKIIEEHNTKYKPEVYNIEETQKKAFEIIDKSKKVAGIYKARFTKIAEQHKDLSEHLKKIQENPSARLSAYQLRANINRMAIDWRPSIFEGKEYDGLKSYEYEKNQKSLKVLHTGSYDPANKGFSTSDVEYNLDNQVDNVKEIKNILDNKYGTSHLEGQGTIRMLSEDESFSKAIKDYQTSLKKDEPIGIRISKLNQVVKNYHYAVNHGLVSKLDTIHYIFKDFSDMSEAVLNDLDIFDRAVSNLKSKRDIEIGTAIKRKDRVPSSLERLDKAFSKQQEDLLRKLDKSGTDVENWADLIKKEDIDKATESTHRRLQEAKQLTGSNLLAKVIKKAIDRGYIGFSDVRAGELAMSYEGDEFISEFIKDLERGNHIALDPKFVNVLKSITPEFADRSNAIQNGYLNINKLLFDNKMIDKKMYAETFIDRPMYASKRTFTDKNLEPLLFPLIEEKNTRLDNSIHIHSLNDLRKYSEIAHRSILRNKIVNNFIREFGLMDSSIMRISKENFSPEEFRSDKELWNGGVGSIGNFIFDRTGAGKDYGLSYVDEATGRVHFLESNDKFILQTVLDNGRDKSDNKIIKAVGWTTRNIAALTTKYNQQFQIRDTITTIINYGIHDFLDTPRESYNLADSMAALMDVAVSEASSPLLKEYLDIISLIRWDHLESPEFKESHKLSKGQTKEILNSAAYKQASRDTRDVHTEGYISNENDLKTYFRNLNQDLSDYYSQEGGVKGTGKALLKGAWAGVKEYYSFGDMSQKADKYTRKAITIKEYNRLKQMGVDDFSATQRAIGKAKRQQIDFSMEGSSTLVHGLAQCVKFFKSMLNVMRMDSEMFRKAVRQPEKFTEIIHSLQKLSLFELMVANQNETNQSYMDNLSSYRRLGGFNFMILGKPKYFELNPMLAALKEPMQRYSAKLLGIDRYANSESLPADAIADMWRIGSSYLGMNPVMLENLIGSAYRVGRRAYNTFDYITHEVSETAKSVYDDDFTEQNDELARENTLTTEQKVFYDYATTNENTDYGLSFTTLALEGMSILAPAIDSFTAYSQLMNLVQGHMVKDLREIDHQVGGLERFIKGDLQNDVSHLGLGLSGSTIKPMSVLLTTAKVKLKNQFDRNKIEKASAFIEGFSSPLKINEKTRKGVSDLFSNVPREQLSGRYDVSRFFRATKYLDTLHEAQHTLLENRTNIAKSSNVLEPKSIMEDLNNRMIHEGDKFSQDDLMKFVLHHKKALLGEAIIGDKKGYRTVSGFLKRSDRVRNKIIDLVKYVHKSDQRVDYALLENSIAELEKAGISAIRNIWSQTYISGNLGTKLWKMLRPSIIKSYGNLSDIQMDAIKKDILDNYSEEINSLSGHVNYDSRFTDFGSYEPKPKKDLAK